MKLSEIVLKVKEKLEDASEKEITEIVNSLESKIIADIFIPSGISYEKRVLDCESDMEASLLLSNDCADFYFYYIMAILAAKDMDITAYENYNTLFNFAYSELSLYFRRNNCPVKQTKIGGRNI